MNIQRKLPPYPAPPLPGNLVPNFRNFRVLLIGGPNDLKRKEMESHRFGLQQKITVFVKFFHGSLGQIEKFVNEKLCLFFHFFCFCKDFEMESRLSHRFGLQHAYKIFFQSFFNLYFLKDLCWMDSQSSLRFGMERIKDGFDVFRKTLRFDFSFFFFVLSS